MNFRVTNPATGKVESKHPTATDAQISDVLARGGRGLRIWKVTTGLSHRSEIVASATARRQG